MTLVVANPDTLDNLKQTYFSIDREYLSIYLYILTRTLVEQKCPDIVNYFNMFNIGINAIKNLSIDDVFQKDFNSIVNWCLDLNDYMQSDFYTIFKESPVYPHKKTLKNLFITMRSHKVFFINMLKDCIFLSQFKFFMHTSFLDTRGRIYLRSVLFTNVHNFHMSKMLIKLYKPSNDVDLLTLFDVVKNSIKSTDIQEFFEEDMSSKATKIDASNIE